MSDICFVTRRYRPPSYRGGIERYVDTVARELDRRGIRTRVIAGTEDTEYSASIPHNFVGVPAIPYLGTWVFNRRAAPYWRNCRVVAVQFAQFGLQVPSDRLFITVHSTLAREVEGLVEAGTDWKDRVRSWTLRAFGVPLERRALRRARRVIAIGEHIARELVDEYGVDRRRVHVVSNGVDTRYFSPPPAGERAQAARPLRVLCVGRLVARKRFDVLVRALRGLDVPVELRIVGAGPDRERIESLARELGVAASVVLRGFRSEDALLEEYRWADLLAMPSLFEGVPLSVLEAKACGVPTVAAPFRSAPDMLAHGTGLVVRTGAPEEFAAALREIYAEPERLDEMSRAAREDALRRYSWEVVIDRLLEVYSPCLPGVSSGEVGPGHDQPDRVGSEVLPSELHG